MTRDGSATWDMAFLRGVTIRDARLRSTAGSRTSAVTSPMAVTRDAGSISARATWLVLVSSAHAVALAKSPLGQSQTTRAGPGTRRRTRVGKRGARRWNDDGCAHVDARLQMGGCRMDAELIAIGPYSKDIISYLPYHPDNYSDVTEGTKVIAIIHHCDTTTESRDLAETFGFEAWDFNSHFFKI